MRFLDNLSKTLSSGVDRAKYEADKFQRTTKINNDIANLKAQVDTNMRQLGERALELYQQGSLQAPEIASLAQIIAQLREQQAARQVELDQANAETFEQFQASQPATPPPSQNVPVSRDPADPGYPTGGTTPAPSSPSSMYGYSGPAPSEPTLSGVGPVGTTPYACSNCGFALPDGAVFCPNCGSRSTQA